jgi:hypothetical protein
MTQLQELRDYILHELFAKLHHTRSGLPPDFYEGYLGAIKAVLKRLNKLEKLERGEKVAGHPRAAVSAASPPQLSPCVSGSRSSGKSPAGP